MKVLFVAAECVPFIKTGGLADVAGALPRALKRMGVEARVMLPKYGLIHEEHRNKMKKIAEMSVPVGWRQQYCGIEELAYQGVTYYFIDNEYYFKRDSLYGHYDDGERFSYFCTAVLESLKALSFIPNWLHCHDWHTGMIPFLLKEKYQADPFYRAIKSIFTIHNLQFQGVFPAEIVPDLLNLSYESFRADKIEFYGNVNFMKAGIVSANLITTVSDRYKNEIQTEYYGEKLDGVLREHASRLFGIVNGIDYELYNPRTDKWIAAAYDYERPSKKSANKRALQEELGLPISEEIPIISLISRLTSQKGLDLITHVFEQLVKENIQFVVLGTGEYPFEEFFKRMQWEHPSQVRSMIAFDEPLARRIYAGADFFLMPSKFEPCGLGQLIAMRYGTIPIVRETGGLNDTVQSYNEFTNEGTGFSFRHFNAHDMLYTIKRALSFYKNKTVFQSIVKKTMEKDYSWTKSAEIYHGYYRQ